MTTGRCNCGAVEFELELSSKDIFACHCSICRQNTGTQGVTVLIVPEAQFQWTRGQELIRHWKKPDADWHCAFCDTCGSALPGRNDEQTLYVPAGLITADEGLRLAHHIWVESRASWDEIGDSAKQHAEAFIP